MIVNIYEAKTKFSQLIDQAVKGKEIIIARNGRPIARLVPYQHRQTPRRLGILKGHIRIAEDFEAPLPEDVLASFEGNP